MTVGRPNGDTGAAGGVHVRELEIAGPAGLLAARLYRAAGNGPTQTGTLLVFFHAGGFVSGSLDQGDPCMRELAGRLDAAILAPTYAQAPDQPFPAAAEDAYAVIADCAAHPRRYRWTGATLVVGGVEAGGNLAAVAALMARDRGGPPLAGQLLVQPMLDPGLSSASMRSARERDAGEQIASQCADGYRGYLPRAADRVHPYACPLASTRLKGLPPALMVSIEGDPLGDEATAYGDKLARAGVPVRTLVLSVPPSACAVTDPTARCRASFDVHGHAEMVDFIASLSSPPPAGL